jgi:hypothetical protein
MQPKFQIKWLLVCSRLAQFLFAVIVFTVKAAQEKEIKQHQL